MQDGVGEDGCDDSDRERGGQSGAGHPLRFAERLPVIIQATQRALSI